MTSILPPNSTQLERLLEQAVMRPALPVPIRTIWSADECPAYLLPFLAWALSIDTWSNDWPEGVRRDRIRQAYYVARRKGTVASVRAVVASFGASIAIREWWQQDPPSTPRTFDVVLNINAAGAVPADYLDSVIDEIVQTKPLGAHFNVTQGLQAGGAIGMIAVARPAVSARIAATAI